MIWHCKSYNTHWTDKILLITICYLDIIFKTALYSSRCGLRSRHLNTVYCVMGWPLAYSETPLTIHILTTI